MSLAELNTAEAADSGIEIDVLNPKTNIPTGVKITILGTDSETFLNLQRKQQNRRMENLKNRRGTMMQSAEEVEADSTELLLACIKSWRTVSIVDGNEVSRPEIEIAVSEWVGCTPENAKRLLTARGFKFVREQIDREMGDRSNFLKG